MQRAGLVLGDLGDGAHGAFLDALAAADAGLFVHGLGNAVGNFQDLLRARVHADAAANALVGIDYGMSHYDPFLVSANSPICIVVSLCREDTKTTSNCKFLSAKV